MSRKRAHRKYRPADASSWAYAIAGNWPMDQDHATGIMNKIRVAYQLMRDGHGTDENFDRLAAALNIGLIRAEKIGRPVVEGIGKGIQALLAADRRKGEHGRYGFSGPELLDMNCAIDLYEEILRNSTPRQMQEAENEAAKRLRAGQAVSA